VAKKRVGRYPKEFLLAQVRFKVNAQIFGLHHPWLIQRAIGSNRTGLSRQSLSRTDVALFGKFATNKEAN